jgi:TPR repeat protein
MRPDSVSREAHDLFQRGWAYAEQGDDEKAVFCYRRAADIGHAGAQCNMGTAFEHGKGVPATDHVEAARYYALAAKQGLVVAIYNLALCYSNGIGVEKDDTQAVRYFREAAEHGDACAQGRLGACYQLGTGVAPDVDEAAAWYERAAENGDATSMYDFGLCCLNGRGVPRDALRALRFFHRAAEIGHVVDRGAYSCACGVCTGEGLSMPARLAQCHLAWLYDGVSGVERDGARAAQHFRLACGEAHSAGGNDENLRMAFTFACKRLARSREFVTKCCLGCGATRKLKTCDRCHVAKFCSTECIERTWPLHRPHCRAWRE